MATAANLIFTNTNTATPQIQLSENCVKIAAKSALGKESWPNPMLVSTCHSHIRLHQVKSGLTQPQQTFPLETTFIVQKQIAVIRERNSPTTTYIRS